MATPTYIEEFYDKFEHPQINRLTVGFSGIDPQQKTLFEAADYDYSKLTPAQQKVIEQMIASYVSKLSIRIDSGNVDPATPEPEPPTVTLRPSEIPHEDLAGLLGGDKDGHYHLTDEQHERLTAYPAFDRLIDDIADDLEHNSLKGLQGGTNNEYYHLKRSDFEALAKLIAALLPNGQTVELPETIDNHEELVGLLGGDLSGHYHLTKSERDKLSEYPEYDDLAGEIAGEIAGDVEHNALKGLQGGKSGERYHLSQEEVNKLAKLAAALMPDGQTVTLPESGTTDHELLTHLLGGAATGHYHLTELEIQGLRKLLTALIPSGGDVELPESGTNDHEALQQLLGGNDDGHYHLTGEEHLRLQKIIAVLFPAGGDEPIFPYDPSYPDLPGELSGGLPTGTPPNWIPNDLPSGYVANESIHSMYYGDFTSANYDSGLFVKLKTNSGNNYYLYNTKDLLDWGRVCEITSDINRKSIWFSTGGKYIWNTSNFELEILRLNYDNLNGNAYIFVYSSNIPASGTSTAQTINAYNAGTSIASYVAACVSPTLECMLVILYQKGSNNSVFTGSRVYKKLRNTSKTAFTFKSLSNFSVNPGCAAWSSDAYIFCIAGAEGTAISADGENWEVHTEAPHNLRDLTFREDIGGGNFLAWSEEDRLFYISNDGITWVTYGVLPPAPSEEGAADGLPVITAVDYNHDLQWYCAVGGTGKYAYFSKDLKTWVRTTITNGTAIEAGSVIWMPSTQKYVLMPTSGSYYYTFSPADWEGATDDTGA